MSKFTFTLALIGTFLFFQTSLFAQLEDTLEVNAFQAALHDGGHREVIDSFPFPPMDFAAKKLVMRYKLTCPSGGCDPWDRIGSVFVLRKNAEGQNESIEIGRVITPYGRGYTWYLDITDYRFLLADSAKLKTYIDTWVGGGQGWLVTVDFLFIEGTPEYEAYKAIPLWQGAPEYGNPTNPIDSFFKTRTVFIDTAADMSVARVTITGHGQGNTENGAEFHTKTHQLSAGAGGAYFLKIWRDNCAQNPCQPQAGTWPYNRAGWCPGSDVIPKRVDVTADLVKGQNQQIGFEPDFYENLCRPGVQPCQTSTCPDCNYNGNGHTTPVLLTEAHLIFLKKVETQSVAEKSGLKFAALLHPNPAQDRVNVTLFGPARLRVTNAMGVETALLSGAKGSNVFDVSEKPAGVYFLHIDYANGAKETKRFVVVR